MISPLVRARKSARSARGKLIAERLEDRLLLAPVSWNSDSSGFGDDAANWSTGVVPGPADDVTIDRGAANPTITIRSGGQSVNSVESAEAIARSGGSLTVAAPSSFQAAFAFTGGTLNANGPITSASNTDWSGGSFNAPGVWTNTGTLTLSGSGNEDFSGTLNNAGTIVHSGSGPLRFFGATLNNQAGAMYEFQSDADLQRFGSDALNNFGTIRGRNLRGAKQCEQHDRDARGDAAARAGDYRRRRDARHVDVYRRGRAL
jgi:hypothetical protein